MLIRGDLTVSGDVTFEGGQSGGGGDTVVGINSITTKFLSVAGVTTSADLRVTGFSTFSDISFNSG